MRSPLLELVYRFNQQDTLVAEAVKAIPFLKLRVRLMRQLTR